MTPAELEAVIATAEDGFQRWTPEASFDALCAFARAVVSPEQEQK